MTQEMGTNKLFEVARDQAAKIFKETEKVLPFWHTINDVGEHMLIATPWNSAEDKRNIIEDLRVLFEIANVQRYAYICETWSVELKINETSDVNYGDPRPSEHPDRRETLRILVEDRNGKVLFGHYYILRPEHGPPKLSPFHADNQDDLQVSGLMTHMLGRVT